VVQSLPQTDVDVIDIFLSSEAVLEDEVLDFQAALRASLDDAMLYSQALP
jgi:hypothetical protein